MTPETEKERHLEAAYLILRNKLDAVSHTFMVSREDAEDLIQDGYIKLKGKELCSSVEAKCKLWITIRNLAIDGFRRKKTKVDISNCEFHFDDNDNLDTGLIYGQMKDILSPLQHKIMTLLVKDDLDYREIAERLGMNEGSVRTAVSRARKLLKEKLER